ncbi:MAG: hypothetical protein RML46_00075 [Anaerolineae bacterium]|nr:hypothetical protein [Anaerolineae bacterium]MDW8067292.1 hypothetical protein [Anaerolineae bacterium]
MATNLLRNGDFERGWEGTHHRCVVYPVGGTPYERDAGEIACPAGWTAWYRHGMPVEHDPQNTVGWAAPEIRPCGLIPDPVRVRSGQYGCLVFTFSRIHDAGLFQRVNVAPGTRLRLTAYAHAWSSGGWGDPNCDNPRYSAGAGTNPFYAEEGTTGLSDDLRNFTFRVGIDPTGGTSPYAPTVVWGKGAHIYNAYRPVPPVEVTAQGQTVTVFLRSRCLWPFKHNDAYWDDVVLEVVSPMPQVQLTAEPASPEVGQTVRVTAQSDQPLTGLTLRVTGPDGTLLAVTPAGPDASPPYRWNFIPQKAGDHSLALLAEGMATPLAQMTLIVRPRVWGLPREQYERTYVLLPPGAGVEWVRAILESGAWDRYRWTIGGSADDAGIGALLSKRVIAINPQQWPGDLEAFFRQYYPGTRFVPLVAATPEELRRKLAQM